MPCSLPLEVAKKFRLNPSFPVRRGDEKMIYNHPLEIPKSNCLYFSWTGERVPCPVPGIHGDTHPQTWAADDQIYISVGDPNWVLEDGKPRGMTWQEALDKP